MELELDTFGVIVICTVMYIHKDVLEGSFTAYYRRRLG